MHLNLILVGIALASCLGCGGVVEEDRSDRAQASKQATLFLNFRGVHLTYGSRNDSAIGLTTLADGPGPYRIARPSLARFLDSTTPTRAAVVEDVRRRVERIYGRFALNVVSERPTHGVFTMLVVGTSFSELQFEAPCPLAGLAVRDCSGSKPADVGFVAAGCVPSNWTPSQARQALARTIAHEAGHTFGLTHNQDQESLMAPASTGVAFVFGPVPIEDRASCQRREQDDGAVLRRVLGER